MKLGNKNCHERIRSNLSLGVKLRDEETPDKNVTGEVFLKAYGVKKQPFRHTTGYFLFIDLPEGKYKLTAGGKFYEQEDFLIDTESVKPEEPFIELFLRHSENKPSADASIKIKGKNKVSNSNKSKYEKGGNI